MSKLFKLKKWLTLPEAARHLSIAFGEEVSEADVLRLALDGHLKLSVNFVNHAHARCGKVVPIEDAKYRKLPQTLVACLPIAAEHEGKPVMVLEGLNLNDQEVLELERDVVTLKDIWDLPLIGNERLDVEHEYQNLTGGPSVTLQGLDGAFVRGRDGQLCQLQDSYDENEYQRGSRAYLRELEERIAHDNIEPLKVKELLDQHNQERSKFMEKQKAKRDSGRDYENYYPAGGLPRDSVLVIRADALREFEDSINDMSSAEKRLTTTERNTLLTIIAALCDFSDIKHQERGAAAQIAKLTDEIGATVTDDTVRKVLAKIPDALEARMK